MNKRNIKIGQLCRLKMFFIACNFSKMLLDALARQPVSLSWMFFLATIKSQIILVPILNYN